LGYDDYKFIGVDPSHMSNLPYISFRDNTVNVAHISCGFGHTCALFANKRIYCWGSSGSAVLGQYTNRDVGAFPGSMTSYGYIVFSNDDDADMISGGYWHSYEA
jgi:hypothetical protein